MSNFFRKIFQKKTRKFLLFLTKRKKENMINNNTCRNTLYCNVTKRLQVPDDKVNWSVIWPDYNPPEYTQSRILSTPDQRPEWADDSDWTSIKYNSIDKDGINRLSHYGFYDFDIDGRPLNPCGRTGLRGRGFLGRWGPNHAADALVSRKVNDNSYEIITITRKDTLQQALPGGMVDRNEDVVDAAIRELKEEVFANSTIKEIRNMIDFSKVKVLYAGYVDDHRNTDNAWIETVVYHFPIDSRSEILTIVAADDALDAKWTEAGTAKMYSDHGSFVNLFLQHVL